MSAWGTVKYFCGINSGGVICVHRNIIISSILENKIICMDRWSVDTLDFLGISLSRQILLLYEILVIMYQKNTYVMHIMQYLCAVFAKYYLSFPYIVAMVHLQRKVGSDFCIIGIHNLNKNMFGAWDIYVIKIKPVIVKFWECTVPPHFNRFHNFMHLERFSQFTTTIRHGTVRIVFWKRKKWSKKIWEPHLLPWFAKFPSFQILYVV